jgi:hypothetical protein
MDRRIRQISPVRLSAPLQNFCIGRSRDPLRPIRGICRGDGASRANRGKRLPHQTASLHSEIIGFCRALVSKQQHERNEADDKSDRLALTCFVGNRTIYRYLMLAPQTVMRAALKTSVAENAGQQHTHTASRTSRSRSRQRNSHLCSRTGLQSNTS